MLVARCGGEDAVVNGKADGLGQLDPGCPDVGQHRITGQHLIVAEHHLFGLVPAAQGGHPYSQVQLEPVIGVQVAAEAAHLRPERAFQGQPIQPAPTARRIRDIAGSPGRAGGANASIHLVEL